MNEFFPINDEDLVEPDHRKWSGYNLMDLAKGPNPQMLHEYFEWMTKSGNDDILESAVKHMQKIGVGFHALTVARIRRPGSLTGEIYQSMQFNFYHGDTTGHEDPHGHSRNAKSVWYATEAVQEITRWKLLQVEPWPHDRGALSGLAGLSPRHADIVANVIVDKLDGMRPDYFPTTIGRGVLLGDAGTGTAPLGTTKFPSHEVHSVKYQPSLEKLGEVAVSTHWKGPEESRWLSTIDGLMLVKGLTLEQAQRAVAARESAERILNMPMQPRRARLGPTTMVYHLQEAMEQDPNKELTVVTHLDEAPEETNPEVALKFIIGGRETLRNMVWGSQYR